MRADVGVLLPILSSDLLDQGFDYRHFAFLVWSYLFDLLVFDLYTVEDPYG